MTALNGESGLLNAAQLEAADVDKSGDVTPKDAVCIQKYYNFNVTLEEPKTWTEILESFGQKAPESQQISG